MRAAVAGAASFDPPRLPGPGGGHRPGPRPRRPAGTELTDGQQREPGLR
jgi:hypothetical protein